jgi:energy-converting hydrogenase Eha subunit C
MGKIIGAKEWENKSNVLDDAGDYFDLSTLFLQIGLVLGAIALVLKMPGLKKVFLFAMIILGIIGIYYGYTAYMIAVTV